MNSVALIGSGFSSLSAACYLANQGREVVVYEKNEKYGGRASQYKREGFTFDMGPTWYWMPDVFERFFNDFGKTAADYYELNRLEPGYQVYFGKHDSVEISSDLEKIHDLFEKEEPGSSIQLQRFLSSAKSNYELAVTDMVYQPGESPLELISPQSFLKLDQLFKSIRRSVEKGFSNPRLRKLLEFPVLFLGATPKDTPSLYNFMNWADFGLGTWHPNGGMYKVVEAMVELAEGLGVQFVPNAVVENILVDERGVSKGLLVNGEKIHHDIVLSGADYHHTEQLLPSEHRQYSDVYWGKRNFAPSALLFYVAFDKKIEKVSHHTLFFDKEFDAHAEHIYSTNDWPEDPLFYASFPSITDSTCAPSGKEAATFLIPISIGLEDGEEIREKYFEMILDRLEKLTGQRIREDILFKKSYCVSDFQEDYNSYKGNAYGLANTLKQTAFLRPRIKSKKVENLFFTGQLTVPGPGVPPALISGKIAAESVIRNALR